MTVELNYDQILDLITCIDITMCKIAEWQVLANPTTIKSLNYLRETLKDELKQAIKEAVK